jgi:hypothetical protein
MQSRSGRTLNGRRSSLGQSLRAGGLLSSLAAGLFACTAWTSSANAGFSTINAPPVFEAGQAGILDHTYGGSFTLLGDGVDFSNGSLTAVRVSDFLPVTGTADSPGANGTDQLWNASSYQANVVGSFASVQSSPFGYIPGTTGGSFVPLFTITGSGYNAVGSGSFSPSGIFRIAAVNELGQLRPTLSSSPTDNLDGKDHVVTYEIDGLGGTDKTWLAFFDDYGNTGGNPDFDYQDLVIQLKTAPAGTSSVPEPASFLVIGGTAIILTRRVRSRKA